ncbi:hypothetical protein KMZ32_10320 [Phycicoccus sp. MAQZ13P-2]|uniref:hypothetical protein n=1 Tax=Phycicoccus mangrovi TaxID=2840470 RepID=UPI001C0011FD|nr:hypothetical protein [Phycicoccus mangrovi]MBT9255868.1 hypothetical protein [Phycicoccus mangrovi]MBT9274462.1 hypothetical protein [Phycicoccus mangrovi]
MVRKVASEFLAIFLAIASIVGLYLAADQIDRVWIFWVTVPAAAAITFARVYGKKFFDWANRIKNYNRLLKEATDEKVRADDAESRVRTLQKEAEAAHAKGVEEGARALYGSILATACALKLQSVVVTEKGLSLVATWAGPPKGPASVGSRYQVEAKSSNTVFGTVEVVEVDREGRTAQLAVISRAVPDFWSKLEERATLDDSPPNTARLTAAPTPIQVPGTRPHKRSQGHDQTLVEEA